MFYWYSCSYGYLFDSKFWHFLTQETLNFIYVYLCCHFHVNILFLGKSLSELNDQPDVEELMSQLRALLLSSSTWEATRSSLTNLIAEADNGPNLFEELPNFSYEDENADDNEVGDIKMRPMMRMKHYWIAMMSQ